MRVFRGAIAALAGLAMAVTAQADETTPAEDEPPAESPEMFKETPAVAFYSDDLKVRFYKFANDEDGETIYIRGGLYDSVIGVACYSVLEVTHGSEGEKTKVVSEDCEIMNEPEEWADLSATDFGKMFREHAIDRGKGEDSSSHDENVQGAAQTKNRVLEETVWGRKDRREFMFTRQWNVDEMSVCLITQFGKTTGFDEFELDARVGRCFTYHTREDYDSVARKALGARKPDAKL